MGFVRALLWVANQPKGRLDNKTLAPLGQASESSDLLADVGAEAIERDKCRLGEKAGGFAV